MKTIGLIGGMSWESTAVYYRYLNEYIRNQYGDLHSAKCVLYSFNFQDIVELQKAGRWEEATKELVEAAKQLKAAGAELLVICTNTMHLMADEVEEATGLPLIHIIDALAMHIEAKGLSKVGVLGTKFTMEQPFYKERMLTHGIELVIPDDEERSLIHEVIFSELCRGQFNPDSKKAYMKILEGLTEQGAEGVILGCTEIPLLISQEDTQIPLFDSTKIHAESAIKRALLVEQY